VNERSERTIDTAELASDTTGQALAGGDAVIEDDLLVEEVSIDGMCGVY